MLGSFVVFFLAQPALADQGYRLKMAIPYKNKTASQVDLEMRDFADSNGACIQSGNFFNETRFQIVRLDYFFAARTPGDLNCENWIRKTNGKRKVWGISAVFQQIDGFTAHASLKGWDECGQARAFSRSSSDSIGSQYQFSVAEVREQLEARPGKDETSFLHFAKATTEGASDSALTSIYRSGGAIEFSLNYLAWDADGNVIDSETITRRLK